MLRNLKISRWAPKIQEKSKVIVESNKKLGIKLTPPQYIFTSNIEISTIIVTN